MFWDYSVWHIKNYLHARSWNGSDILRKNWDLADFVSNYTFAKVMLMPLSDPANPLCQKAQNRPLETLSQPFDLLWDFCWVFG